MVNSFEIFNYRFGEYNKSSVQDIAALSEENVNVANWVNSTLQKTNDQPNKEVFCIRIPLESRIMLKICLVNTEQVVVSSLVTKLQLYVQQVNSALEDTSQQVLAGMPRIVKDAQVNERTF